MPQLERLLAEELLDARNRLVHRLLEGGDELLNRLVLRGIEALLPSHDKVGAPGAE